ncbi:MAG: hypothetical protein N2C14_15550 [Planctomycetales bacterium]
MFVQMMSLWFFVWRRLLDRCNQHADSAPVKLAALQTNDGFPSAPLMERADVERIPGWFSTAIEARPPTADGLAERGALTSQPAVKLLALGQSNQLDMNRGLCLLPGWSG